MKASARVPHFPGIGGEVHTDSKSVYCVSSAHNANFQFPSLTAGRQLVLHMRPQLLLLAAA